MIPILETKPNQSNTISPSSIESRNLLLQMLNVVVPNPLQTPLLLSLVSSVHSRDPILLQHYTLCIEVDNVIQMVGELTEAISSVYPFVENISIGNGILLPNITNETKEYTKHPLQVSSGSVLIISTTQEIQSDNFELLLDLIEKRTLRITMYNVNVDIPVDCKNFTQYCDQTICIHQGFNNKNIRDFLDKLTPQEIEEMRHYLAYCNVTTSFVSARQQNSKIDQMTLHQWLNTSSILGSSYGLEEVTEKIWEEMLEMRMQLTN
ncbi:Mini-chromosome maintenance complex-binding protein [Entamoeba marina]